jgi:hypothetical protein
VVIEAATLTVGVAGGSLSGMGDTGADDEPLRLERGRLRLERQRLALEIALKRRELSASPAKGIRELTSNPILIAFVGGFITILTGMATATYTAAQNRKAEAQRAELSRQAASEAFQGELIKKFVEGSDAGAVRENLKFLSDAGLIPDYSERIGRYLTANPQSAPSVNPMEASATAEHLGLDNKMPPEAQAASDLLRQNVINPVEKQFRHTITIRSGYRSPAVNRAAGGSPGNSHERGEAIDFVIADTDLRVVACWIRDNLKFDELRLEPLGLPGLAARPDRIHVSYRAAENRMQVRNLTC